MTLKQVTNLIKRLHKEKDLHKFRNTKECARLCKYYDITQRQMNFALGVVAAERIKYNNLTKQILSL